MSRPNSSEPHICRSDGGASRVAKLICAGSCGAIHAAKTANTTKQTTKTQPIAASGLRLANRGRDVTVVAIAEIAEVSLANYGSLAGRFHVPPEGAGKATLWRRERTLLPSKTRVNPVILQTITPYLCAQ